jgi:hypothetical protein
MADKAETKAKDRKNKKLLKAARKEIDLLLKRLNAGTIDRNELDSGLRKVRRFVRSVAPHYGGQP